MAVSPRAPAGSSAKDPAHQRPSFGVRGKLLALVMVVLIPIIAVYGVGVFVRYENEVQRELKESEILARAVSSALVNHLEKLLDMERAVGSSVAVTNREMTPDEIEVLLKAQLVEEPTLMAIGWMDAAGITRASTHGPSVRGLDISDREFYQRILAGEDRVVANVTMGKVTDRPTVLVAHAIRKDGRLLGMVAASLDLTTLDKVLPPVPVERRQFGFLDRNGRIIYRNDYPTMPLPQRETRPDTQGRRSLSGETVLTRSYRDSETGTVRMGISIPVEPLGWAYFTNVPVSVIMREFWTDTARNAVAILLAAAVSVALATYLGRSLLHPILALQRAARAISAGDLGARVALPGSDEIAAAAQTFDNMAARVQVADEIMKARVTAVARLSQEALAGAPVDALADAAAGLVALSLNVEAAAVLEMLPASRQTRIQAAVGFPDGTAGMVTPYGYDMLAALVADGSQPMVLSDIPAVMGDALDPLGIRILCGAAVAITGRAQPYGALVADSVTPRQFSESDLHFLQAVANVIATAIDRRRLEAEQAFLARAGSVLAGSLDTETTLENVTQMATEFLGDWVAVDLFAAGVPAVKVKARASTPEAAATALALEERLRSGAPYYQALRERMQRGESKIDRELAPERLQAAFGDDLQTREVMLRIRPTSFIAVPLVAGGKCIGGMSFATCGLSRGFDEQDLALAQELARRAALAMDHARLYAEATRALAGRDRALAEAETERKRLYTLFEEAPAIIQILHGPDLVVTMSNRMYRKVQGTRATIGRPKFESQPELVNQGFKSLLDQVYRTGIPYEGKETRVLVMRGGKGPLDEGFFDFVYQPIHDSNGQVEGIFTHAFEVTEQVKARRQVEALAADLRMLARQQAAIAALGQRLISGAGLQAFLTECVEVAASVLGLEVSRVLELQPDGQHFVLRARVGPLPSEDALRVEDEPGVFTMAGYTLSVAEPVIVTELQADTRFAHARYVRGKPGISGVAVRIPDEVVPYGVLSVASFTHLTFTQDDVNFLQSVSHMISRAVQHQRDRQRLDTQHTIARILAEGADEAATTAQILKALCHGLGWDVSLLWLIDPVTLLVTCTDMWQVPEMTGTAFLSHNRGLVRPMGRGMLGQVYRQARPVWLADATREDSFRRRKVAGQDGLHGGLWIPILVENEVLGIIECFSREVRRPDQAVMNLAANLGSQIGQFILRRRAESELRQLNAQLEDRVAERTAELKAANQELESFAYSVSHDLRAPLRTVDGFSQALVEDCGDLVGEDGKDYIRRIRGAARNMGSLIEDLLRLSRVMRQEIRREQVDLTAMGRSVLAELQREQPERDVRITVADGLTAYGDERLLRLVLLNLLSNALKFTSRTPQPEITFGAEKHDGRPVFFVRDNGAGFDMAYADKLFVPFQRLHLSTEFDGTGVGLATVQRVIQRHGGRVWAEGKIGHGATFYFTL